MVGSSELWNPPAGQMRVHHLPNLPERSLPSETVFKPTSETSRLAADGLTSALARLLFALHTPAAEKPRKQEQECEIRTLTRRNAPHRRWIYWETVRRVRKARSHLLLMWNHSLKVLGVCVGSSCSPRACT